jgi:hypothetical protein
LNKNIAIIPSGSEGEELDKTLYPNILYIHYKDENSGHKGRIRIATDDFIEFDKASELAIAELQQNNRYFNIGEPEIVDEHIKGKPSRKIIVIRKII